MRQVVLQKAPVVVTVTAGSDVEGLEDVKNAKGASNYQVNDVCQFRNWHTSLLVTKIFNSESRKATRE
jgi:hypothetical protein